MHVKPSRPTVTVYLYIYLQDIPPALCLIAMSRCSSCWHSSGDSTLLYFRRGSSKHLVFFSSNFSIAAASCELRAASYTMKHQGSEYNENLIPRTVVVTDNLLDSVFTFLEKFADLLSMITFTRVQESLDQIPVGSLEGKLALPLFKSLVSFVCLIFPI